MPHTVIGTILSYNYFHLIARKGIKMRSPLNNPRVLSSRLSRAPLHKVLFLLMHAFINHVIRDPGTIFKLGGGGELKIPNLMYMKP